MNRFSAVMQNITMYGRKQDQAVDWVGAFFLSVLPKQSFLATPSWGLESKELPSWSVLPVGVGKETVGSFPITSWERTMTNVVRNLI